MKAEPTINDFLKPKAKEENIPVFILEVGLRDEWKNPEHVARKHPKFRLTGVPAICFIEN